MMTDLTIFQRLRDAAVRRDGIRLEASEVRELFEREGDRILDHARSDDAAAFGAPEEDAQEDPTYRNQVGDEIAGDEEVPGPAAEEEEPGLGGLSAVSGD